MIRPRHSNPREITFNIRGRPGQWQTSAPGMGAASTFPAGREPTNGTKQRIGGRPDDGIPNAQAFSIPVIQTYPARTKTCRECPELNLTSCARGCCHKLSRGHAFLLNAITDAACPLGKFGQEL